MRWSFPIARVFGISVRMHVTFLLLLAFFAWAGYSHGGVIGAIWSLAFVIGIFTCVVLHELGHSVVAQKLGVEVKSITLLPIGGVASLRSIPENPVHEILITIAGPLVNVVIAAVLYAVLPDIRTLSEHLMREEWLPLNLYALGREIMRVNIILFLFNLVPAFPMDGGRLLRATLAFWLPYTRATAIAASVGQACAVIFVVVALTVPHMIMLMLIGFFIFIGAESEEKMVRMRSILREIDVEDVMTREFECVSPTDSVGDCLEKLYQTTQDDFPVMENGVLVGLLTRQQLLEALRGDSNAPVAKIMEPHPLVVTPRTPVLDVYERMLGDSTSTFPVIEHGQLVGLLSSENVSRYFVVKSLESGARRKFLFRRKPPVIQR